MTAKTWSVSQLAVEIGADRRTVSRIIATHNIQPAGEVKGSPVYRLRDFLAGWRAEWRTQIEKELAPLPDQQVLFDCLESAMHALKAIHDARK